MDAVFVDLVISYGTIIRFKSQGLKISDKVMTWLEKNTQG